MHIHTHTRTPPKTGGAADAEELGQEAREGHLQRRCALCLGILCIRPCLVVGKTSTTPHSLLHTHTHNPTPTNETETVIIENVGEELDATLDPVLARAVYKKGRRVLCICMFVCACERVFCVCMYVCAVGTPPDTIDPLSKPAQPSTPTPTPSETNDPKQGGSCTSGSGARRWSSTRASTSTCRSVPAFLCACVCCLRVWMDVCARWVPDPSHYDPRFNTRAHLNLKRRRSCPTLHPKIYRTSYNFINPFPKRPNPQNTQTKLPNPHYKPEVAAQCTLVNFIATEKGLEDQLLSKVSCQHHFLAQCMYTSIWFRSRKAWVADTCWLMGGGGGRSSIPS